MFIVGDKVKLKPYDDVRFSYGAPLPKRYFDMAKEEKLIMTVQCVGSMLYVVLYGRTIGVSAQYMELVEPAVLYKADIVQLLGSQEGFVIPEMFTSSLSVPLMIEETKVDHVKINGYWLPKKAFNAVPYERYTGQVQSKDDWVFYNGNLYHPRQIKRRNQLIYVIGSSQSMVTTSQLKIKPL